MSILDDINAAVIGAFGGDPQSAFRPAVLTKITPTGSVLSGGETRDDQAIRALASNYSERTRALLDLPDTTIKIIVLTSNDLQEKIEIELGDVITTTEKLAGTWVVEKAQMDPTESIWTLQAKPA